MREQQLFDYTLDVIQEEADLLWDIMLKTGDYLDDPQISEKGNVWLSRVINKMLDTYYKE